MQLVCKTIAFLMIFCCFSLIYAQDNEADTSKIKLDDIEISFLMSYYTQDGNHSPVTGGQGTEELTNTAPSIVVNIPLDTSKSIIINAGVDVYSSASSDNINNPYLYDNHVSGASAQDTRAYANISYKIKNKQKGINKSIDVGVSNEYDVSSFSGGGSIAKLSKDKNKEIGLKAMYYYDSWKLIFPMELRNGSVNYLKDNARQSFNFTITGSSILTKRLSASISSDFVMQSGLLSTPFHRVFFQELTTDQPKVENLPDNRMKIPVGLRANYHINDWLIVNSFYRYYWDNWDMTGHTVELELPLKISQSFRLYPFYRFHSQTAVKYFGEYKTFTLTDEFYTSDFDLSELTSHKYGIGLSYDPLYGVGRYKGLFRRNQVNMLKSIDFRYAYYDRSDGLSASIFTLGLNFKMPNF